MRRAPPMQQFSWEPGKGMDAAALERLQRHAVRPAEPMGEAWFMSDDRQMFDALAGDLSRLDIDYLKKALNEIASGTSAFGPSAEWQSWYHYLLGRILPRAHEASLGSLLESLINGFFALYPDGVQHAPYPRFLDDVLTTLGRSLMEPHCWNGTEIKVGAMLRRSNNNPAQVWGWWDASGDFSASMFFCLKYLPPACVHGWLQSVLAIPSPHWRAQVLVWLVGSHDILTGKICWPSEFDIQARPSVDWEWACCLRPELLALAGLPLDHAADFLPATSRELMLQLARTHFTSEVYLAWLESIDAVPYLAAELTGIPSTFEALYVRDHAS